MAKKIIKKVLKHLKKDIGTFKHEANEDRELIKDLKKKPKSRSKKDKKFEKVLHEFKEESLKSGSKKGPVVKNPKQALAIAYSEAKKESKKKKK